MRFILYLNLFLIPTLYSDPSFLVRSKNKLGLYELKQEGFPRRSYTMDILKMSLEYSKAKNTIKTYKDYIKYKITWEIYAPPSLRKNNPPGMLFISSGFVKDYKSIAKELNLIVIQGGDGSFRLSFGGRDLKPKINYKLLYPFRAYEIINERYTINQQRVFSVDTLSTLALKKDVYTSYIFNNGFALSEGNRKDKLYFQQKHAFPKEMFDKNFAFFSNSKMPYFLDNTKKLMDNFKFRNATRKQFPPETDRLLMIKEGIKLIDPVKFSHEDYLKLGDVQDQKGNSALSFYYYKLADDLDMPGAAEKYEPYKLMLEEQLDLLKASHEKGDFKTSLAIAVKILKEFGKLNCASVEAYYHKYKNKLK